MLHGGKASTVEIPRFLYSDFPVTGLVGVTITCYGGVNEIGGNKVLVQDKDTKLFLDWRWAL
jgi:hypothetical protein